MEGRRTDPGRGVEVHNVMPTKYLLILLLSRTVHGEGGGWAMDRWLERSVISARVDGWTARGVEIHPFTARALQCYQTFHIYIFAHIIKTYYQLHDNNSTRRAE